MSKIYSNMYLGDSADYFKRDYIKGFKENVLLIKPIHLESPELPCYEKRVEDYQTKLDLFFKSVCKGGLISYSKSKIRSAMNPPNSGHQTLIPQFANCKGFVNQKDFRHVFIDPAVGLSGFKPKPHDSWGRQGEENNIIFYPIDLIEQYLSREPESVDTLSIYQYIRGKSFDYDGGITVFLDHLEKSQKHFKYAAFTRLNDHLIITLSKKPCLNEVLIEQSMVNDRVKQYQFDGASWTIAKNLKAA